MTLLDKIGAYWSMGLGTAKDSVSATACREPDEVDELMFQVELWLDSPIYGLLLRVKPDVLVVKAIDKSRTIETQHRTTVAQGVWDRFALQAGLDVAERMRFQQGTFNLNVHLGTRHRRFSVCSIPCEGISLHFGPINEVLHTENVT